MATELESTVRTAAEKIGKYIADVATMTVETWYVEIGPEGAADFGKAKPVAQTIIKLDADCKGVIPMRKVESEAEGGAKTSRLEVDADLLDIHERNVKTATEYRASILNALLGILK